MANSLPKNWRVNDQVLIEMQFFDHAVPPEFRRSRNDAPIIFPFATSMAEFAADVVQALHKMGKCFGPDFRAKPSHQRVFNHAIRMADSGGQKVSQGHKMKNLAINVP